ncbi:MAG: DUF3459 domain-containing protein [Oscillospiraceae bacterium]|nr:DUF3459 domain-containing protein [Oscillospiraceae bacterium]
MASWLDQAVFYEIYPQSFRDTNGDGIGDFAGIIEKLPYLKELGVNALWLNPCFDSSFYDAGYDVRDYYSTAPRYGSNEDLCRLFAEAHSLGFHVLLDLVPGHTAVDHPWFRASSRDERNEFTDRYIWRGGSPWGPQYDGVAAFLCGMAERPGAYAVNCFASQPALNYGFGTVTEPWQFAADSPEAERTRLAMVEVMDFWLGLGCDGFRVDMAGSLVKADPDRRYTIALWRKIRAHLDESWPEAALVSEWGAPAQALEAGFHMDFLLHTGVSHYMDLFRTAPYFAGGGELREFVDYYNAAYAATGGHGLICLPSGNHDMVRMRETLDPEQMKTAFAFLLTMPGCPFLYYGDEIGMRYVHGLKSKEGGYHRTGSRTPMQWSRGVNAAFSSAAPDKLYLPVDPDPDRPDAQSQQHDPDSLWRMVQALLRFRREHHALRSGAAFRFLTDGSGYPLAYERSGGGERLAVALNPSARDAGFEHPALSPEHGLLLGHNGAAVAGQGKLTLPPNSFAVWAIE